MEITHKMAKKVVIIGAGPAGLSAGCVLSEKGFDVHIFECESCVGGMSKSLLMFEQIVDMGPHRFFSKDKRINDFWSAYTKGQSEKVERLTRIFYNQKFFYYPLRGFDALFQLGIFESALCVLSFLKAKIKPFGGDSFESWVANAFGYRLYSIFFKSYTQKLWGMECKDLDSDFARQRIKGLSLYEAAKSAFWGDKNQKHKTLVDEFSYPKKGCGVVYENMANQIMQNGGKIICGQTVTAIVTKNKKAIGIRTKNADISADIVISTAPFKDMVLRLDELSDSIKMQAQKLKFRNTILVYVEVENKIFDDNWIYVHSQNMNTGRITNFANWTKDLKCGKKTSIVCLEYWANDDESLWNWADDKLCAIAKQDLLNSGLLKNEKQIKRSQVVKIYQSYPVYEKGYKEGLNAIYNALDEFKDLYFIGRGGAFKYNNQDHSLLMGLLCADKILGVATPNLWNTNTDYDYQEDAKSI